MTASPPARAATRRAALLAATALLIGLLPLLSTVGAAHVGANVLRFAGEDRFDTARLIAADPVFDNADTVVVARADDFADALAGALIAGHRAAPLLLTGTGELPPATVRAITRISPRRAVILGGSAAVGDAVERRLEDFRSIVTVERISGEDRYDTARRIAERVARERAEQGTELPAVTGPAAGFGRAPAFEGPGGDRVTAVLATGENFPDALAAGPLSAGGLFPILLTEGGRLSEATRAALRSEALAIEQVLIVGGTAAVSETVEADVRGLDLPVRRIGGAGRTFTARSVAEFTRELLFPPTFEADTVAVANGRNFPDALALGPLAARRGGPLVITESPSTLSAPTHAFLVASCAGAGAEDAPVLLAGGTAAVSGPVEAEIQDAVVCGDFVPAGGLRVTPVVQTATVGQQVTVTASGVNRKGAPAEAAAVTFEVFRDVLALPGPLPEDTRLYRESTALYRKVGGSTLFADAAGTAVFGYSSGSPAADRVVVCTPPSELPNPGCTDETGALREDVTWANVVVQVRWVAPPGGPSGLPAPPLP
ncbi:MAG TPA: cell wall-binding repeat-containing protein [Egibacteraceae bacterium]|nr:cell wall-binding repeat-containing protein [Egibacteraceae bacterium]